MKAILPLAGAALFGGLMINADLQAQQRDPITRPGQRLSQEEYKLRRAEKLAKDFLKKADWLLDYDEARAEAERQGKWIFTYFTRTFQP